MEAETFHLPSGKWNIGPYRTIEMKVNESRENNLKKKIIIRCKYADSGTCPQHF